MIQYKSNNLEDLSPEEMISIDGGSQFSNWTWEQIGQGVGYLVKGFKAISDHLPDSAVSVGIGAPV